MDYVMGVDPGLTGAVVVIDSKAKQVVEHAAMPTRPMPGKGRRVDALALFDIVVRMQQVLRSIDRIVLEDPGPMPKQGVVSVFSFGRSCGVAEGVLVGLGIPMELISPAVWKRVMRVPAKKDAARFRASQLMPASRWLWAKAKDDGFAEAALIALWGAGVPLVEPADLFGGL